MVDHRFLGALRAAQDSIRMHMEEARNDVLNRASESTLLPRHIDLSRERRDLSRSPIEYPERSR